MRSGGREKNLERWETGWGQEEGTRVLERVASKSGPRKAAPSLVSPKEGEPRASLHKSMTVEVLMTLFAILLSLSLAVLAFPGELIFNYLNVEMNK